MDAVQILLLIVIIVLTGLLIILGVQVFYILRELRRTLRRVNSMMDDVESITSTISQGVSGLTSLSSGIKLGTMAISLFKKFSHKEEEGNEQA